MNNIDDEDLILIPEKLLQDAADSIDLGMTVVVNLDTWEFREFFGDAYYSTGEEFDEETNKVISHWKHKVEIVPMDSSRSFNVMESFVSDCVEDKIDKQRLFDILHRRKPFANYNLAITQSKYRDEGFEFKRKETEQHVHDEIVWSDEFQEFFKLDD